MKILETCCLCLIGLFAFNSCFGQLFIIDTKSPEELVYQHLLSSSSSLVVSNVKFKGHPRSTGTFYHKSPYAFFEKGIILSTGLAVHAKGPNLMPNQGIPMLKPGDTQLSAIAKASTYDACVLEFDFVSDADSLVFDFFFASEEYPEYVNKGVNDVFGFFLSSEESDEVINLAQLPNGKGPVTVDNINSGKNAEYFFLNEIFDKNNVLKYQDNREVGEFAYAYQFDGFTKPITAYISIEPGKKYHLKIAIADVGDSEYDSAVFLKANSFKAAESLVFKEGKNLEKKLAKRFNSNEYNKTNDSTIVLTTHIKFEFDSDEILPEEIETLQFIAKILREDNSLKVLIAGHTDTKGSDAYNLNLSEKRALQVKLFLGENESILSERLNHIGMGKSQPLIDANTAEADFQNRRVEFTFVRKNGF